MINCDLNFDLEENKLYVEIFYDIEEEIYYKIYDIDTDIYLGILNHITVIPGINYWTSFSVDYKNFEFLNGFNVKIFKQSTDELILEKEYRIRNNPPFCNTKFKNIEDIDILISGRLFANLVNISTDNKNDIFGLKNCNNIVDLGSSIGVFTAHALTINPNIKSIMVELSNIFHNICCETFKDNENIIPLNNAIHKTSNKEIVYYTENENGTTLSNSVIENQYDHIDANIQKSVNTISLDDIIERYNLDKIDFLKIDIEGYEYEFMENISDETLSKIDRIHIEFHNSKDIFRRYNIIDKLSRNGFGFLTTYESVNLYSPLFTLFFIKKIM